MHRFPLQLLSMALLLSCSNAALQPLAKDSAEVDDRLTVSGRVCTRAPDPNGFPVKVLFIVDKSGSMCVSDPPGSQGNGGICELISAAEGYTVPGRVKALTGLLSQFTGKSNVSVSIVPFETNVDDPWPTAGGFGPASAVPPALIDSLQNQLGKGTDYTGAFSEAFARISTDIIAQRAADPSLLQRTRYVVVFLTDGTPYPRCSANDDLSVYAGPDTPWLTWADSSSAGDYCDKGLPPGQGGVNGFNPGSDLNQNYQIFDKVKQIMALQDAYNVGDIRIHTVLLFNEASVQECNVITGGLCEDIYGVYPGVPLTGESAAALKIAQWTLQQIASLGNGVYQEFDNGDIQQLSLGALDYTSLASKNVMKTLMLQSLSSVPGTDGKRDIDSDGDNLPDSLDNPLDQGAYGTSRFNWDTDADCFSDSEEVNRKNQGFDPLVADPRGRPATASPGCPDTDGDGLSTYAENFVGTHNALADTDADGIMDGIEENLGLNPLVSNAGLDTDGDGIPDVVEVRAGSNPTLKDNDFFNNLGYQYSATSTVQADGSLCYDYTVSNVQLVTPPARAGARQGYNLFRLLFAEAAESGVSTDYGIWKEACAWAQFDPPSVRVPAGPELDINNANFYPLTTFITPDDYVSSNCVGTSPALGVR